jgi:hypothetical protein
MHKIHLVAYPYPSLTVLRVRLAAGHLACWLRHQAFLEEFYHATCH